MTFLKSPDSLTHPVLARQLDIVLHDKQEKICVLIDIAIPDDSNNIKDQQ
jgi:hypothetical protein